MWVRAVAVLGAVLAFAGGAGAGGFAPVTSVTVAPATSAEPTPLEWVRYVGPRIGRDVVTTVGGQPVATIEWHREVAVRVRTESGALLTPAEQAAVRDLALTCREGEVRGVMDRVEPNGTYVVEYDCAWLQLG